jgi:high frequency lysogenization protein
LSKNNFHSRAYQAQALAVALTALEQVHLLATTGRCDNEIKSQLFDSILVTDSDHPNEIYPDSKLFNSGAKQIIQLFTEVFDNDNRQRIGYLVAANRIAKYLLSDKTMQNKLQSEIARFKQKAAIEWNNNDSSSNSNDSIVGQDTIAVTENRDKDLSLIYENTLSTLPYRINIHGSQSQLERDSVRNSVRAQLLAAIRALVLWRQLGGNALQLFLKRESYVGICRQASANF